MTVVDGMGCLLLVTACLMKNHYFVLMLSFVKIHVMFECPYHGAIQQKIMWTYYLGDCRSCLIVVLKFSVVVRPVPEETYLVVIMLMEWL